jgi:hypothetical protein
MAQKFKGWLHIPLACKRYGTDYNTLRKMVRAGVFTRGRFTSEAANAPVYVRIDEMNAWKKGGIDAVRRLQAQRAAREELEALTAPVLGGEGG